MNSNLKLYGPILSCILLQLDQILHMQHNLAHIGAAMVKILDLLLILDGVL